MSIEEVEPSIYYDFHVPRYQNYWACGVFHHNSGKSYFLATYYLALIKAGIGVTLIDPHGDLSNLILRLLVQEGNEQTLKDTIYLDFQRAHERGRYLPLNVLKQPGDRTRIAQNVKEAFHRAWPSLAGGVAPRFDKLVLNGVKALASANERLPELSWFLTNLPFRAEVLAHETDSRVLRHWKHWYDTLTQRQQTEYADSTLSRVDLLAFDEVLRYSLGHEELALDFRSVMDRRQNVLLNLSGLADETQRLIGSLFTVMYEQAAKGRADTHERPTHVLMIDEFASFSAQSESAMQKMLSETRKFGLFLVMAHQNWSQASSKLKGAMGNTKIKVAFQLDREDAEITAMTFADIDPVTTHTRDGAVGYSKSVADQIEETVKELMQLPERHALVKFPDLKVNPLVTEEVKDQHVDTTTIEREQLERWFKHPTVVLPEPTRPVVKLPIRSRLPQD